MEIESPPPAVTVVTIWLYFAMKIIPMLICAFAIWLGYKLFVLGVTGEASIVINAKDVSGQLINAAPGLFFAVGGIVGLIASVLKSGSVALGEHDDPSQVSVRRIM